MQEKHFLYSIAKGHSIQTVAAFTGYALIMVKDYCKQILKKLECAN